MDLRETFSLSLGGLSSHKLRTLLTMLGIIFGVAAVISMLSIGEGAKQEALEQIRQMGIHNIIVQHWKKEVEGGEASTDQNLSAGLNTGDGQAIAQICPLAQVVAPQRETRVKAQSTGRSFQSMAVGTIPEYFAVLDAQLSQGVFFSAEDLAQARRVCVLGSDAKRDLFYFDNPLGAQIDRKSVV